MNEQQIEKFTIGSVEMDNRDAKIISLKKRKLYMESGGFSIYGLIKMIWLMAIIILDISIGIGDWVYEVQGMGKTILLFLIGCNIFLFRNGDFLYINRYIIFRFRYRLPYVNLEGARFYKNTLIYIKRFIEDEEYYIQVKLDKSTMVNIPVIKEIYSNAWRLYEGETIIAYYYKEQTETGDEHMGILDLKELKKVQKELTHLIKKEKRKEIKKY